MYVCRHVALTECYGPTVALRLSLCRFHGRHRLIPLPGVPYLHTPCRREGEGGREEVRKERMERIAVRFRTEANPDLTLALTSSSWLPNNYGFPALHTFTDSPSLLPVTSSGAPPPIPSPPHPSSEFTICSWAFTEYTGASIRSKSLQNHTHKGQSRPLLALWYT